MQHVCLICQPFSSPLIPLCLQGCFSPGIWSLMWFRTLYQMNRDQGSVHHYEKRAILDCSRFVKCCIKITQSDFRFLISFRGVSCKLPRKQAARKSSDGGGSQLRTVTYLFKAPNTCSMEEPDLLGPGEGIQSPGQKLVRHLSNSAAVERWAWASGAVAVEWYSGLVVSIFKKGDQRTCSNYHDITHLSLQVRSTPWCSRGRVWFSSH